VVAAPEGWSASTRRGLLSNVGALAALGLGPAALAGCGHRRPRLHEPLGASAADVALLNAALALEQRAIAAYTAAAPLLSGDAQHAAGRFLGQQLTHAGELRRLIKELGGHAHEPLSHYHFGHPRGRAQLLALLHGLEQQQIAAYLHALPLIAVPEVRQSLGAILANHAQHVTVLRAEQGLSPLTGPFVTAAE